jgi:hypothetical protein
VVVQQHRAGNQRVEFRRAHGPGRFPRRIRQRSEVDARRNRAPREPDGSLPANGFARLVAGSDLIDKGVDVGLPYTGSAPDLGAFEFSP